MAAHKAWYVGFLGAAKRYSIVILGRRSRPGDPIQIMREAHSFAEVCYARSKLDSRLRGNDGEGHGNSPAPSSSGDVVSQRRSRPGDPVETMRQRRMTRTHMMDMH